MVEVIELLPAAEAALRRRHEAAPGAVWAEVAEMGFLYRRGETFVTVA